MGTIINALTQTRRQMLQTMFGITTGALLSPVLAACSESTGKEGGDNDATFDFVTAAPKANAKYPFELPPLPYPYDALQPSIDGQTMQIHHDKHHQGYTDKLNAALKKHPDLQQKPLVELLANPDSLPEDVRTDVRNNGGGYFNHALFWPILTANGDPQPEGKLARAIEKSFGSFSDFKEQFATAAGKVFGSGWAWLVANKNGELEVMQTKNQDTPLMHGKKPVLGIDVWEHAYYLKYQNRRAEYVENFWNIVNWQQCAQNFDA